MAERIGIGVIGMGWMGQAHSRAYSQVNSIFPEYNVHPELVICADENDDRASNAQNLFGFKERTGNWQDVLERSDVDLVCVCAPNFLHAEIATAVANAGKHVMCEKPVGRTPAETLAIAKAARDAGVNSAVGYNYRWTPVVQYARNLVESGEVGKVQVYDGRFFSLYGSDPLGFWSWRFDQEMAGTGAVGDLLVHAIDMALWINGPIDEVVSTCHTFIKERPVSSGSKNVHYGIGDAGAPKKPVTNEDYVSLMVKFRNGARGNFDASRTVYGPKCELRFDLYGDKGSIKWNFERMNEIEVCLKDRGPDGYTQVLTSVVHPFHDKFNPGDAIALGYPDLKIIEAAHFLKDIKDGKPYSPGLHDAALVANVTDAAIKSWSSERWEKVAPPPA